MAVAQAASPQDAAQQVMDFGEVSFPQYFPVRQSNSATGPFLYRYYPQTGIYLGVVVTEAQGYPYLGVYVMGGEFGNTPYYVGPLGTYITPVTAGLALSGTVSRSSAMSGGTVTATCRTGTATTTTTSSGTYSMTVPQGVQPCILVATSATTGASMYAASAGGSVANITPLTTLVVAGALGKDAGTAGTLTQSTSFAALTPSNLSASLARTVSALQALGITLDAGIDPVTQPFVAGTAEAGHGDSLDQVGVQLVASLAAANIDLSSFANTVGAAASPSQALATVTALAASAGIPTSRLAGCPFAVSGKYWVAESGNGAAPGNGNNLGEVQADFATMTAVSKSNVTGATHTFTMTAETDGSSTVPCGVKLDSGSGIKTLRMSTSGLAGVGAAMGSSNVPVWTSDLGIAVFASPLALSDLQGTWYVASYDLGEDNAASPTWGKVWTTGFMRLSVGANGSTQVVNCEGATAIGIATSAFACGNSGGDSATITSTGTPGLFRFTASNGDARNLAVFRGANGDMAMLLQLAAPTTWAVRSFGVGAKRVSGYTTRSVGSSWQSGGWTLNNINSTATNPGAQQRAKDQTFTVTAVNGTSLTRQDNSQPAVTDTVVYDTPYPRLTWRPVTATQQEWVGVTGSGWTVLGSTNQGATGLFGVSIQRY